MTLVSPELKEGVRKLYDRLNSPEYNTAAALPTSVTARMTGPQSSEAKFSNFTLVSDEPGSVGGDDTAPPPSSIFVAAVGFAENVIFARQAALHGVEFDSMETTVEARWDRRGIFGISDADPAITSVLIETRIQSQSPPEKVAELILLTGKRSPMTATVAKAAAIRRKLLVNGLETKL